MQGHSREIILRIQEPWGSSGVWPGPTAGKAAHPWGHFLSWYSATLSPGEEPSLSGTKPHGCSDLKLIDRQLHFRHYTGFYWKPSQHRTALEPWESLS